MKISEIRQQPQTYTGISGHDSVHESVLRSYHIVGKVREMLEKGWPNEAILYIIELMEE